MDESRGHDDAERDHGSEGELADTARASFSEGKVEVHGGLPFARGPG
jgi:hypothetical protein